MSDSTQQYILKRQPKIEMTDERIYFKLPWGEWWTSRKEHESDFVDIPAIESDLEDIILELQDDDVATCINKILVLFGLENKETK